MSTQPLWKFWYVNQMKTDQHEFLREVLLDDELAVSFCELLGEVSQIWDDLVDEPENVDRETIDRAFWLALFSIPNHPFFKQHQTVLTPTMMMAAMDWINATDLEKGGDHCQNLAFGLRDRLSSVVTQCAMIVGGYEHARKVGPMIHHVLNFEGLDEYKEGLKHEHRREEV